MEAIRTEYNVAHAEAARWLGDWHPLVHQIAPGDEVATSVSVVPTAVGQRWDDPEVLGAFFEDYKITVLLPYELPAVKRACEHTVRNEMNELVALDQSLIEAAWLKGYADHSRASGRAHLERLQPLRDQRGIRRYQTAVAEGRAQGWHFLVAGAALGLYAVPLRQGLMDYALHIFWNGVAPAVASGGLDRQAAIALVNVLASDLPRQIQTLFPADSVQIKG